MEGNGSNRKNGGYEIRREGFDVDWRVGGNYCATCLVIEKCDEVCAAPNGEGRFALWVGKSRGILLGLLFGFYFGGLGLGAAHFPHGYDWRRNVISNLLSPRDNPGWYGAPVLGVAMAGLCMMALMVWIGVFFRDWMPDSFGGGGAAASAFGDGYTAFA